jgi:cAMP-dependent protein kinase regulator
MDFSTELIQYLKDTKTDAIFKDMAETLYKVKPKDTVGFLILFLNELKKQPSQTKEELTSTEDEDQSLSDEESEDLNEEILDMDNKEDNSSPFTFNTGNTFSFDKNDGNDEERKIIVKGNRRKAISSESINMDEIKNYVLPSYQKTEDEKKRIQISLSNNALFSHIEKDDLNLLYDALFTKIYKKDEVIIQQGDKGDNFYVVDSGVCNIYVKIGDKEPFLVKTVKDGDYFGELALMYGTPRAATVKAATEEVKLWAIDRMTYRKIVMGQTQAKRELYESFLKKVPLLSSMTSYERLTVADALQTKLFEKDQNIITEGDQGDEFYILVDGECEVHKKIEGVNKNLGFTLKAGAYFGELALLFDQPRAATIKTKTNVKTVYLDRRSFKLLLGQVEDILKRNSTIYEEYMKKKFN